MRRIVLVYLFICFSFQNYGQANVTAIDSSLNAIGKKRGRFKKIKFGNNATGTVYFYLKKNKKIFSINDRKEYRNPRPGQDSSIHFIYLFLDDKLVKVRYYRFIYPKQQDHVADFYFSDNKLISTNTFKDVFTPDISVIISNARSFLIKAYQIRK